MGLGGGGEGVTSGDYAMLNEMTTDLRLVRA